MIFLAIVLVVFVLGAYVTTYYCAVLPRLMQNSMAGGGVSSSDGYRVIRSAIPRTRWNVWMFRVFHPVSFIHGKITGHVLFVLEDKYPDR